MANSGAFAEFLQTYSSENHSSVNSTGEKRWLFYHKGRRGGHEVSFLPILIDLVVMISLVKTFIQSAFAAFFIHFHDYGLSGLREKHGVL